MSHGFMNMIEKGIGEGLYPYKYVFFNFFNLLYDLGDSLPI